MRRARQWLHALALVAHEQGLTCEGEMIDHERRAKLKRCELISQQHASRYLESVSDISVASFAPPSRGPLTSGDTRQGLRGGP
jgi:hypothetical protein